MIKIYKIRVNLVSGQQLTYTISEYETLENGFIRFLDGKTNTIKIFDGRNCQIEEFE